MSHHIQQIQIPAQQFRERFTVVAQFNDSFARQYFITTDQATKKRTIYKHYLAQTTQQLQAIFDSNFLLIFMTDIENYIKLSEQDDICKILACTRLDQQQQVLAAFQYDEFSLSEYIQTQHFAVNKPLFYIQVLSSLTNIIKSMCDIGIDVDQLNYGNILVFRQNQQARMKLLYDEREKTYDKILEGMKTFTSIQKLTALVTGNEEYFNQLMEQADPLSPQNIYQLGLLLIDLMYAAETQQAVAEQDDFMVRDRPVSRSSIINPDKSYYKIQDGRIITLNEDYLNEKLTYLQGNSSHVVKELANLTKYMIAKQEQRITIIELLGQVDRIFKIYRDSSKKVLRTVSDDSKKKLSTQKIKGSSSSIGSNQVVRQNIVQNNVQENHMFGNNVPKNTISRSAKGSGSSSTSNHNYKVQVEHQNILRGLDQGYQNQEYQAKHRQDSKGEYEQRQHSQNNSSIKQPNQNKVSRGTQGSHNSNNNHPSANEVLFSSYSSHKNDYTSQVNKDYKQKQKQKTRQATNSHTLSTTKQTITSKTNYTAVINQQFNYSSKGTLYENQKSKPNLHSQNKLQQVSNQGPIKMVIPKQHILMNLRAHESIKSSLENLIVQIQALPQLRKKQYYDNSVYYGQVSARSNKRSGLGLYVYPSGDIYFGTWLENQLINGTYIFKNGQSYEGSVKNGKQGWGRYRYSNGNVYEGEWKDDIKQGKGTMWYPNQDKYEGQWVKGKKNGWGKYFYNNATLYEGNFINGRKHGFGTINFPNGTKIQANWHQTHVQGQGKVFYPNGDFFHGQYYMSQKHGKGLYIWGSDNTKYQGQFKKDSLQGEARIYFTSNEYYFGRIRNGKRDGQGTYSYENGDLFHGEWKNDVKLIGHYKFKNGDEFQGKFKDNQLNFGVLKYANGQIYQGEFRNGYRHGVGSYRDRYGEMVCEGHWENDHFISSGQ